VLSGAFTVAGNGGALNGQRVDLILRSGGSDKSVANTLIDSNGAYSFLGIRATNSGEVYYVRFSNPNGGNTLRFWNSATLTFDGVRGSVARADLVDVALGNPGNSLNTYQLPLTLNWSSRGQGDSYSIVIYRSDGSGVALNSGNLGAATSYTIAAGALAQGDYFAEVGVSNGSGAGVSQRQFRFRISNGGLLPGGGTGGSVTSTPAPTQSSTTAVSTTAAATATSGSGSGIGGGATATTASTTAAATTTASTSTTAAATATSGSGSGIGSSNVAVGNGLPPTSTPGVSGTGNTSSQSNSGSSALPGGSQSLPQSGGELPIAGLVLAALTLIFRRFRLTIQTPRGTA
jgi:hypothetical protein